MRFKPAIKRTIQEQNIVTTISRVLSAIKSALIALARVVGETSKTVAVDVREFFARGETRYPNRREQWRQVRRSVIVSLRTNVPLFTAGALTAAVALSLVGVALTVSAGVSNATIRWRGGVETIIFMNPDAPEAVVRNVGESLRAEPFVKAVDFVSKQEAYDEFSVMFRTNPELVRSVNAQALPASWRVSTKQGVSVGDIETIGRKYGKRVGVYQVAYAKDAVSSVLRVSAAIRWCLGILALALGGAAWLLAISSCRASAWARRDELAVMRLVGAPRWVLRLPFMIEGAFQGLLGASVAGVAVWKVTNIIEARVGDGGSLAIVQSFNVSAGERWRILTVLLVVGGGCGALGATLAIGRYVRVREGLPANLVLRQAHRAKTLVTGFKGGLTQNSGSLKVLNAAMLNSHQPRVGGAEVKDVELAQSAFQDAPADL